MDWEWPEGSDDTDEDYDEDSDEPAFKMETAGFEENWDNYVWIMLINVESFLSSHISFKKIKSQKIRLLDCLELGYYYFYWCWLCISISST